MKKKLALILSLAMSLSVMFTACNSGGSDSSPSTGGNDDAGTSTVTDGGNTSTDGVKTGGTLKIGTSLAIVQIGYTPEASGNAYIPFLRTMYNTLLWYDNDGNLVSDLATDWETDPDALTITFKLREGVTYHDGTPFNAEAVKWNIEQYQGAMRSEVASVKSMDIEDDHTIVMNLDTWNSSALLSIGTCVYFMSPTAYEANGGTPEDNYHTAIGTGPFALKEFNQTISVLYEANPNYFIEGQPYLDGVEFYIIEDVTTSYNSFIANELDIVNNMGDLSYQQLLSNEDSIIKALNTSGVGVESVGLIPSSSDPDSPFADADVRKAMNYAIDVDTLIATIGQGQWNKLNQWAVTGSATWSPNVKGQEYDPEMAKQLLEEAGYPDGFDTVLHVPASTGTYSDLSIAIADMLTAVGIRATVNVVDGTMNSNQMTNGWDGLMWHFASISPDLGLWMGRHLDKEGAFYAPGIQHPEDALDLLGQIRLATTDEEKIALSWELQELIYDEYALFGCLIFQNSPATYAYTYVQDHGFCESHMLAWSPATAWLDR